MFASKLVNIKFVLLESSRLGFLGEFFSNLQNPDGRTGMASRREDGSAGHGLQHRAVRDQQVRHLQPRARCSCDIERIPRTLENPRNDNPTRMIGSPSVGAGTLQVLVSKGQTTNHCVADKSVTAESFAVIW